MELASPPPTPGSRQHPPSPLDSPLHRRRTSSFSSNHDRSPVSARSSRHRFSNGSFESFVFRESGGDGAGGGLGNLADELDQMSEEEDEGDLEEEDSRIEEQQSISTDQKQHEKPQPSIVADGARDSGIDVSYKVSSSIPVCEAMKPPDETAEELEDRLSPDLEDLINTVVRLAASTPASSSEDPLIPRTIELLQDLGNQSSLEASTQRLTTSTNSMTSHLTAQSKAVQSLAASLYTPFGTTFLDTEALSETIPLVETLLQELPRPDTAPLHGLQRLNRDSTATLAALANLTDTLQIGKQHTNAASRHLRNTEAVVIDLRHARERAEAAQNELVASDAENRLRNRWCQTECRDILDGFARTCDSLREGLALAAASA